MMDVKKIALVAQEGMKNKNQFKKLIEDHKTFILNNFIVSTEGTAEYLQNNMKIIANDVVNSGKEGGDISIGNMVLEGDIDVVIFILNPMQFFPHFHDAYALVRVCNFKDIPLATNIRTADILLSSISHGSKTVDSSKFNDAYMLVAGIPQTNV